MANTVNKTLLATILRKRQNSEQLNNEEEAYARTLFSQMMDSKKQVRKVVRIVTGEQLRKEQSSELRKGKVDAEATRKDPRYPEGKNPQSIKSENTDPDVNSLKAKIPDVDEKPKTGPHPGLEQDRVSSMTQEAVPPRSEAVKFTSADPVKAGDIVSKNMAKEGTHIVKGVVLKVKDGIAFVKWGDGRTMYEPAHLLVKVKKSDAAAAASEVKADPKLGPSESEEEAYNTPMTKQTPRRRARQAATSARSAGRAAGRSATSRVAASPVGRRVTAAGRRVGQAVSGAVGRAGEAVRRYGVERRQRRARTRTIEAPMRHATRAIGPGSYFRAPAEHARSIGRAIRSVPASFQASKERRRLRALRQSIKQRRKVVKATMTEEQLERSKRLAEQLKGKKGIDNPHALARYMVQQKFTKAERGEIVKQIAYESSLQKDGGIAMAPDYAMTPGSQAKTTPFQDLTNSLQDVVRLAGDLKGKAENTKDEDVKNEYEKLIGQLRGVAETILSGLNSELEEAEAEND